MFFFAHFFGLLWDAFCIDWCPFHFYCPIKRMSLEAHDECFTHTDNRACILCKPNLAISMGIWRHGGSGCVALPWDLACGHSPPPSFLYRGSGTWGHSPHFSFSMGAQHSDWRDGGSGSVAYSHGPMCGNVCGHALMAYTRARPLYIEQNT